MKAYFKRRQGNGFHYYEVNGGPGKTKDGFQVVLNFLNPEPIITTEHNDLNSLMGTWCTYEVGEPISESEYKLMFEQAISHPESIFM